MDRAECRARMGLPVEGRLIGYCGSLHRSRGVEVLFEAFARLMETRPDVGLVLSGRQCHLPLLQSMICFPDFLIL